jgi:chromosomal replication initiation ATPase DnaA
MSEVAYKSDLSKQVEREQIIRGVEKKYGKSIEEIRRSKKRPMKEKRMLIYLLRRLTGLTNREIGDVVGMKYGAVSMAGRKTEEEIARGKGVKKEADDIVCTFEV